MHLLFDEGWTTNAIAESMEHSWATVQKCKTLGGKLGMGKASQAVAGRSGEAVGSAAMSGEVGGFRTFAADRTDDRSAHETRPPHAHPKSPVKGDSFGVADIINKACEAQAIILKR